MVAAGTVVCAAAGKGAQFISADQRRTRAAGIAWRRTPARAIERQLRFETTMAEVAY
jgi:hypothetical protein